MAFTKLLIAFLMVSVASAGFSASGWANNYKDDDQFPFNGPMMSYEYVAPLPLPKIPGFYLPDPPPLLRLKPGFPFNNNFPNLPNPPPLPNFPTFPPLPPLPNPSSFNFPTLPTVDSIINQAADPGSNYVGAAVVSHSTGTRDPDGNIIRKGGSTMMINDNGNVTVTQVGDAPPVVVTQNKRSFSGFQSPKFNSNPFNDFPKFKPVTFRPIKPFTFKPFKFEPIPTLSPEDLKNHVPKAGETFTGTHFSTHSSSSTVNGVKTSSGEVELLTNDNGKVDQEKVAFKQGPK